MRRQTVSQLFSGSGSTQYEVPIYQRRYVWDTENWKTLWTDIEKTAKKMLAGKPKNHFIGTIVTYPDQNRIPFQKHQIIDGQQRLITFQIIFCVIRDLCKKHSNGLTNIKEAADNRVRNEDPNCNPPEARYKLLPTMYDRYEFLAVVDPESTEYAQFKLPDCEDNAKHPIHKAYFYFYKAIKTYVDGNHDTHKAMIQLFNSITSDFKFSPTDLEKSDDPENIFAALNATGKMLYEFDYLRTDLFLRVKDRNTIREIYNENWAQFDKEDWSTEKLEKFLECFLMAKLGPTDFRGNRLFHDVYKGEYHAKLRDELDPHNEKDFEDTNPEFLRKEFEELAKYAKTYQELENSNTYSGGKMQFYKDLSTYENEDNYNSGLRSQQDRNITCVQSFILHLVHEVKISNKDLNKVFEILESFTARRLLVDTAIGSYAYEKINTFFSYLSSNSREFTVDNLVHFLTEEGKRKWITNTEVERRFRQSGNREQGAGSYFQNSLLFTECYIFYRIESWMRKEAGESQLYFKEFPDIQRRMLDSAMLPKFAWASLGNATVLAKFRTEMGGISQFEEEKAILTEPSNAFLMLNQEICSYPDNNNWNLSAVKDREKKLLGRFFQIWPDTQTILSEQPAIYPPELKFIPQPKYKTRSTSVHQGKIKAWLGSYGVIEYDDFQQRIVVTSSDFQDKRHPIEKDQKVEFEIVETAKRQRSVAKNIRRVK